MLGPMLSLSHVDSCGDILAGNALVGIHEVF